MHSHWRTTPTTLSLQKAHGFKSLDYIILQAQIIRWPHLTKVKNVSFYSANGLFWIVRNATSYHLGPFTTSSAGGGLLWQNVVILLGSVTQSTFLRNPYYHIWVNYSNLCNLWTRTSKLFHRVQADVSNVIFLASCSKVIILLEVLHLQMITVNLQTFITEAFSKLFLSMTWPLHKLWSLTSKLLSWLWDALIRALSVAIHLGWGGLHSWFWSERSWVQFLLPPYVFLENLPF